MQVTQEGMKDKNYFKRLYAFQESLFGDFSFQKKPFWWLGLTSTFFGGALTFLGVYFNDNPTQTPLAEASKVIGTAILSGSMFSVLFKAFLFVGVMQDALKDVLLRDQDVVLHQEEQLGSKLPGLVSEDVKSLLTGNSDVDRHLQEQISSTFSGLVATEVKSLIIKDETVNNHVKDIVSQTMSKLISNELKQMLLADKDISEQFKREASSLFTSPDLLCERADIVPVWREACRLLCQDTQRGISDKVEETIRTYYLSTKKPYYTHDHTIEITVSLDDDTNYLTLYETDTFTRVLNSSDRTNHHTYSTKIPLASLTDDRSFVEIDSLKVDEQDISKNVKVHTTKRLDDDGNPALFFSFETNLPPNDRCKVVRGTKKCYPLETNYTKANIFNIFVDTLTVKISYTTNLVVDFLPSGTVEPFKKSNAPFYTEVTKNMHQLTRTYPGVIFPYQGFRIYFQKKESPKGGLP